MSCPEAPQLPLCEAILRMACAALALSTADSAAHAQLPENRFEELAQITARIEFLQQTWNRDVVEQDHVRTQILEARVTGHQTTSVSVRLQSEHNHQIASLILLGTGNVRSTTVGVTPAAQVSSLGDHSFQLVKRVYFDGARFLTRRTYGSIVARSQPFFINTIASGIPILGQVGEQIAWSETLRRQPVTESIVARQVADDLVPDFDAAVDRELASANYSWKQIQTDIARAIPRQPLRWQAETTADSLTVRFGYRSPSGIHLTAKPLHHSALRPEALPKEDLVLTLSDQLINDVLADLPLNSVTVSDAALERLGASAGQLIAADGRSDAVSLSDLLAPEPLRFSLQLADVSPLSVRFEKGRPALIIRFRVKPKIGPLTELHRLTIRLQGADSGNGRWSIGIADVDVESEDPDSANSQMTQLIRTESRQMLLSLPPTELPRLTEIRSLTGLPDIGLREIRSRDGILRVSFQLARLSSR